MNPVALSLILLLASPVAPLPLGKSMDDFIAGLPPLDSIQEDDNCFLSEVWRSGSEAASKRGVGYGWLFPFVGLLSAEAAGAPDPPEELTRIFSEDDRRCFVAGYQHRIRSGRRRMAVTGTLGAVVGVIALPIAGAILLLGIALGAVDVDDGGDEDDEDE